jgi:tetratricopeptide (TPR) repeat protein
MALLQCIAALLFTAAGSLESRAHGDLRDQVARVTQALAGDSNNIPLLLQRGELLRLQGAWGDALADFQRVKELDPRLAAVDFYRGRTLLQAGHPRAAVACLDRFLAREPGCGQAWLARAQARAKLGEDRAAAQDYTAALDRLHEPQPDHFIEMARTFARLGPAGVEQALRGLDAGMRRLGPLVVLQEYAIELELHRGHFDAALARLDTLGARANRKESWLARRGEILEQAARPAAAREAYAEAMRAWERLPQTRREAPAMVELEGKLRAALARLAASAPARAAAASRAEP